MKRVSTKHCSLPTSICSSGSVRCCPRLPNPACPASQSPCPSFSRNTSPPHSQLCTLLISQWNCSLPQHCSMITDDERVVRRDCFLASVSFPGASIGGKIKGIGMTFLIVYKYKFLGVRLISSCSLYMISLQKRIFRFGDFIVWGFLLFF